VAAESAAESFRTPSSQITPETFNTTCYDNGKSSARSLKYAAAATGGDYRLDNHGRKRDPAWYGVSRKHDHGPASGRPPLPRRRHREQGNLDTLAEFCLQELCRRGLLGVEKEASIPGAGREQRWDVAWQYAGKYRFGLSLKSILKNLGGTVPI